MISAENSGNNGKNKVINPHSMVIFWTNVTRSYWDLHSQADPMRENCAWIYPDFNKNGQVT